MQEFGQRRQRLLGVRASDDALDISAQDPRHVRDRLALAESDLALRQVHRMAAQPLHRDVKADARAQRRLFEEERQCLPLQGVRIAVPLELGCRSEQQFQLVGGEIGDGDEVATAHG